MDVMFEEITSRYVYERIEANTMVAVDDRIKELCEGKSKQSLNYILNNNYVPWLADENYKCCVSA